MGARIRWFIGLVLGLSLGIGMMGTAPAQENAAPDPALSAVLAKLSDDPTSPQQYSANITLHVKLKVFPFIALKLKGSSFYKRPGLYRFAFRGVPRAVDNFQNIAYDLGNPSVWGAKYTMALLRPSAPGQDAIVRLTPKKRGMVKALDVSIDGTTGHMDSAVWSRFDSGTITLHQRYAAVGDKVIVSHQEATIAIPHMRAELVADYTNFELDADVSDTAQK